jgi:hypothetical protein
MPGWGLTFLGFFKGLNPLSWLLNPYVIGGIAAVALIGYVYHKGKQAERQRQANEIARLNTKLTKLSVKEQIARAKEDARVITAVERAIANIKANPLGEQCALDKRTIKDINSITRGL